MSEVSSTRLYLGNLPRTGKYPDARRSSGCDEAIRRP